MGGKTITRERSYAAVRDEIDLSAHECKVLVKQVLDQVTDCSARGEPVKLFGFELFIVVKRERVLDAIRKRANRH